MPRAAVPNVVAVLIVPLLLLTTGCLSVLSTGEGGDDTPPTGTDVGNSTTTKTNNDNTTVDEADNTTGAKNGTGESISDRTANTTRQRPVTLPENVTMEDAEEISRGNRSVIFRWNGTVAPPTPSKDDGATFTTLTVPPDRWLKIDATVTWSSEDVHVSADLRNGDVEMCHRHGNEAVDTFSAYLTATKRDTCEIRPDPRSGWEWWSVGVTSPHIAFQRQETSFTMRLEVEVLEGPWADIDPSDASEWPALEDARIRPGVTIGQVDCTTNFVFRSPDNASLYIGSAAHCFDEHDVGVMLTIADIPDAGRIVYCSWGAMPRHQGPGCGYTPVDDPGQAHTQDNDLLLAEIRPDLRHLVHPAMRYWGGPTGITEEIQEGDRVLMYGNSSLRHLGIERVPDTTNPEEGYVFEKTSAWKTCAHMVGPGVLGDSGSPARTGDGDALGILRTLESNAANGFVNLAPALGFLHNETGMTVKLATWPLLEPPTIPEHPLGPPPSTPSCAK